ncbi:MAG: helix-turn-helix domain-containing protein [Pseudooceanicola atlanticus]
MNDLCSEAGRETLGAERAAFRGRATRVTMREIAEMVAEEFDLPKVAMTGVNRRSDFARARFAAFLLCREQLISLTAIGRQFKRDHTTISHGLRRAQHLEKYDQDFAERMARLRPGIGKLQFHRSTVWAEPIFKTRRKGESV